LPLAENALAFVAMDIMLDLVGEEEAGSAGEQPAKE
jgi:hypothetical protein